MKILCVNAGSSSLKFQLYEMPSEISLISGYVEKIGAPDSFYTIKFEGKKTEVKKPIKDHSAAVAIMLEELVNYGAVKDLSEIRGVGHRVVHGGEKYADSVVITDTVMNDIKEFTKFAPLHHPGNIAGIKAMQKALPEAVQVAVFDTAFHQTIPKVQYMYPVPMEWYEKYGVRKYGFHGTSHKYVYYQSCKFLGLDPGKAKVISCHLGNGSSLCAVKGGKVLDTSMGLTPLMGLVMGTRCGDMDPAVVPFIMKQTGCTADEIDAIMNKKSGFLGVSGISSDMRDIEAARDAGDENAAIAYRMFIHRLLHYIGGYYLLLDGADAIVFTGGIGENGISTRKIVVERLKLFGCELDEAANDCRGKQVVITKAGSRPVCLVTPTNEELMIAMETVSLVK